MWLVLGSTVVTKVNSECYEFTASVLWASIKEEDLVFVETIARKEVEDADSGCSFKVDVLFEVDEDTPPNFEVLWRRVARVV